MRIGKGGTVALCFTFWHFRPNFAGAGSGHIGVRASFPNAKDFNLKGFIRMSTVSMLIVACGVLALLYGAYAIRSVLAAPAGTERMQEIASAIQEGANAYLKRQYMTIAAVGAAMVQAAAQGHGGGALGM